MSRFPHARVTVLAGHPCWLYRKTNPSIFSVGFYSPDGAWISESDHSSADDAGARAHYLNGGAQ